MSTKTAIIILVVAAIVVGAFVLLGGSANNYRTGEENGETSSGALAERNAVVASDQQPGETVTVEQVYLAEPGYVVIHEESDGNAGAILGSSALLNAGATSDVSVNLSRPAREGEKLVAMLHQESSGNSTFEAAVDTPFQSDFGGPIMMMFEISSEAEGGFEINL